MELKLTKLVGAATIGGAILLSGPALAQTREATKSDQAQTQTAQSSSQGASGNQPSVMEQRPVEDNKDWGWMGLLGLAGLLGLRRKRDDDRISTVRGAA
jgi:MYXO-CTERM domain-containing protein